MKDALIRTLIRYTLIGIALLVATAAAAAVLTHAWGAHRLHAAYAAFEARWGGLVRREPPPDVSDQDNAARWLVAGAQAIVCTEADQRFYGAMAERPAGSWSDAEGARVRRILHEQRPAVELLRRSADFDTFHLGRSGRPTNHGEVEVLDIVKGLRLLVLDARVAHLEGRIVDAITALDAVSRAADGLMRTSKVSSWVVGSAAARWATWAAADIVEDPCVDSTVLTGIRAALPTEDPLHWGDATLAQAVREVADEKLDYVKGFYDPSIGWSVPFWIPNRYLFEDMVIAEIIERWDRFLELGQLPAARWSDTDAGIRWLTSPWPSWFAMTGVYTPNLLNSRSRAQAAASELQQLRLGIALRLGSPDGLAPDACGLAVDNRPAPLTGDPLLCRFDAERMLVLVEVPGATEILQDYSTTDNRVAVLPPLELPMGPRVELCPGD